MFCSANFLFTAQSNSSVIWGLTLHLIVLIDKVTVEIGINNTNQRVFWSDLSLYVTAKIFLLSYITYWQLQGC